MRLDRPRKNGRKGRLAETASRPRRRPKNDLPLADVLASVLDGKDMTTEALADAALDAGYQTNAKKFAVSVNTCLHRDGRFMREGRTWRLGKGAK